MKTQLKNILSKLQPATPVASPGETSAKMQAAGEVGHPRRDFMKKAVGGVALGGFMFARVEDTLAESTKNVNRFGAPSDLKITDVRVAYIREAPMNVPLIRIETNQGLVGWGEVRDGGSPRYALFLKSRLLGENPCNVERLFKKIKQFGFHGRQAGGVCGIEMALWDLAGKAYNVPAYQLLGGKYRDEVRIYADTDKSQDPQVFAKRMKERADKGITFLKMDFGVEMVKDIPGALVVPRNFDWGRPYTWTEHPFTAIQITDKGLDEMVKYVAAVREAVGMDIPLAADHFGHIGVNSCIRLGKALEKYQLAWLEDMVPWKYTELWKQITNALDTPTLTGEDIYLKEEFIKLIDAYAVDMIHPDLASSGGLLETKKIGDYAEEKGIPMAMHFAGSPVSFMANVHCAAATQNFIALEHHSIDVPWWENLVKGIEKPILMPNGFVKVPNTPGLGVEVNEEEVKKHLIDGEKYFAPTPEWDKERSWDRLWS